jgi:hypothetical protein
MVRAVARGGGAVEDGEGVDPQTQSEFEQTLRRAGGEDRLVSGGACYRRWTGYVQHFTGTEGGPSVICALDGETAVAAAGSVREDACTVPKVDA